MHSVHLSAVARGPDTDYPRDGAHRDPVYTGAPLTTAGDFWPGAYSKTHVGTTDFSYAAVMAGMRSGRIWVDHGGLIRGLDVRVRDRGDRRPEGGTPLGSVARPRRGTGLELTIDIDLAVAPNWAHFVPALARVDVIAAAVTGPAQEVDAFEAATRVVASFEVGAGAGSRVSFTHPLGEADQPFYVRLRGTDGRRSATGLMGTGVDPQGPAMDLAGDADPWADLWFYANPIFVVPRP